MYFPAPGMPDEITPSDTGHKAVAEMKDLPSNCIIGDNLLKAHLIPLNLSGKVDTTQKLATQIGRDSYELQKIRFE